MPRAWLALAADSQQCTSWLARVSTGSAHLFVSSHRLRVRRCAQNIVVHLCKSRSIASGCNGASRTVMLAAQAAPEWNSMLWYAVTGKACPQRVGPSPLLCPTETPVVQERSQFCSMPGQLQQQPASTSPSWPFSSTLTAGAQFKLAGSTTLAACFGGSGWSPSPALHSLLYAAATLRQTIKCASW